MNSLSSVDALEAGKMGKDFELLMVGQVGDELQLLWAGTPLKMRI